MSVSKVEDNLAFERRGSRLDSVNCDYLRKRCASFIHVPVSTKDNPFFIAVYT